MLGTLIANSSNNLELFSLLTRVITNRLCFYVIYSEVYVAYENTRVYGY